MASDAPGFPSAHPTRSYWQTEPSELADAGASAALPERADYVVVGSGISGASVALKLLQRRPGTRVVMLEARSAASGATGRNGGHCRGGMYLSFFRDREALGADEALRIQAFESENVAAVGEFVKQHAIDCDYRRIETADVYSDPRYFYMCKKSLDALDESLAGKDKPAWLPEYRLLSEADARKQTGFVDALGAVTFTGSALQPYKFTTALLRQAMAAGLELFTHTTVRHVRPAGDGAAARLAVETDRGVVLADNVVLATNAYTGALHEPVGRHVIPTRGQMAVVRPGSKAQGSPMLVDRSFVVYRPESMEYCQTRADGHAGAGDVCLGGGRMFSATGEQPVFDDASIHPDVSSYLAGRALPGYFGEQAWGDNGDILMEWTGIMGYTDDSKPFIGEAPDQPGLWMTIGFQGHGMAMTFSAAEGLVQLLLGEPAEWLPRSYSTTRIGETKVKA